MGKVLSVDNLSVTLNSKEILNNISFSVNKQDFVGVIGPNGGGKTTLIKTLLGLNNCYSGTFKFAHDAIISYVPQKESFIRSFPISVEDVVLSGSLSPQLRISLNYTSELKARARELMKKLKIMKLCNNHIGALSGGELQKVLIARALIIDPNVLILDEPTSNIDSPTECEIFNLLKELNTRKTVITISHNLSKITEFASKLAVINKRLLYYRERDDFNRLMRLQEFSFFDLINL